MEMTTKRKQGAALTLAAAAMLAAGVASAAPPQPALAPEAPERGERMEMLFTAVDATEEQRTEVEAIREDFAPRMQTLMQRRVELHESMEALQETGYPVDLKELRTLADEVGDLTADSLVLRAEMQQQIAGVFTEAQRSKLQRLAEARPRPPQGPEAPGR